MLCLNQAALCLLSLLFLVGLQQSAWSIKTKPVSASHKSDPAHYRGPSRVSIHRSKKKVPTVVVEHLTTHQRHTLRPDLPGGYFSKKQIRSMSHLMRCHHTGQEKMMHPDLVSLLYQIGRHYGYAKVYVIAGYRAPHIARMKGNPRSPHQKGIASDIRVDGVSPESLRDYLRLTQRHVGVGYYPNSGFVHVDVTRKQRAYWIDASGPGQRAFYIDAELQGRQLQKRLMLAKKILTKRQHRKGKLALHSQKHRRSSRKQG